MKVGPLHVWSLMEMDMAAVVVKRDAKVVDRRRDEISVMVRFMALANRMDRISMPEYRYCNC